MILLALITTLAVAFLALTQRETGAVDALRRTIDAEQAADSAFERCKAGITAQFIHHNARTNGMNVMGPDFMVSVNRDTNSLRKGDETGPFVGVDPRAPVFVNTNRGNTTGPFDERYYLDLNRNTNFEDTATIEVTDVTGRKTGDTNFVVGDPQWIGVLQDPLRPPSPTNRFISRYAYAIQPIGR